jgi:hypothetical protein
MRLRYKVLLTLLSVLAVLSGALAWRIYTWGRPLPVAYRPIAVMPAGEESGRSVTYLRKGSPGKAARRYVAFDTTGDGSVDLVLREGTLESFSRPSADDAEARWLILCLDGVPYAEMLSLWEEGYFREFFRPVPLIAPFPSASGIALTTAFHTGPVQGYEDGYFDVKSNRLAGGALTTTTGEDIPYLKLLDYDMPGYFKGPTYVLPHKSYRADLGRLRQRFLASGDRLFLAHIASSDSLYHILPAAEMRRLLVEVDALLRELYFDAEGKLRITLFSDHGNSLVQSRAVPLKDHLAARGWRLSDRCGEARQVVAPAYGLLGFFSLYCAGNGKGELASHLARMEGVDLVVYRDAGSVVIENAQGQARLSWNQQATQFRYQPLTADPLALSEILAALEEEGRVGAEGWAQDADLFEATSNHLYPDPAHRLWQWGVNHVRNPGDLVVNLRPGYHYGSSTFNRIVRLLSTHGGFDRHQTLGFATSTDRPLAGPIRSQDLLPAELAQRGASTTRKMKEQ